MALTIELVNKTTRRIISYHVNSLNVADCFQAPESVRERETWVPVALDIPDDQAVSWLRGDDSTLSPS